MTIIGRALLQSLSQADLSANEETPLSLGDAGQGLRKPQAGVLQPAQFLFVFFPNELFKCYYFLWVPRVKRVGKPANNGKN